MDGLHIVADLYRCRGNRSFQTDATALSHVCLQLVAKAGLTTVAEQFHQFEGGGVTGCVVLAESHLAIHTWPELESVTVDVYVCNYTQDNSHKARQVMDELLGIFQPEDYERQDILRSQPDRAHAMPLTVS